VNQLISSRKAQQWGAAIFAAVLIFRFACAVPPKDLEPVPPLVPIAGEPFVHAGPLVGYVGPDVAHLWVKASNAATLAIKIGLAEDLSDGRVIDGPELEESAAFTGTVIVPGLKVQTRYFYAPMLDGRVALARPYPSFVTAPEEGAPGRWRIAFGSCVGYRGYHPAAAFGEMAERRNFDLLLLLGDNHYGDTTDPDLSRANYFIHRTGDGFAKIARQIPVCTIWDDHDFGPNNSDGTAKGKQESLRVFREWWANRSYGEPENPGVYWQFSRGDVDFFMLDGRYYRTPNDAPEDGSKTMLGERQLAWLKAALSASKAKFKLIAAGSEWSSRSQPDCWMSFARERREIFEHIQREKIEGVVLLSGDRHFTAGYQVQGRFVEFTSGPLGSGNAKLKENTERFTGADEGKLWMILELDTTAEPPRFFYEIWQAGRGPIERRELSWEEINGRAKIAPSKFASEP
jgi:alkaline phosphatase D